MSKQCVTDWVRRGSAWAGMKPKNQIQPKQQLLGKLEQCWTLRTTLLITYKLTTKLLRLFLNRSYVHLHRISIVWENVAYRDNWILQLQRWCWWDASTIIPFPSSKVDPSSDSEPVMELAGWGTTIERFTDGHEGEFFITLHIMIIIYSSLLTVISIYCYLHCSDWNQVISTTHFVSNFTCHFHFPMHLVFPFHFWQSERLWRIELTKRRRCVFQKRWKRGFWKQERSWRRVIWTRWRWFQESCRLSRVFLS